MDLLTFISNMTGALAWPTVVGAIAYVFRAEFRQLLIAMKKLKLGPVEAEMYEQRAKQLRRLADELPSHEVTAQRTAPPEPGTKSERPPLGAEYTLPTFEQIEDELLGLAESTTAWGRNHLPILSAWNLLEDSLRSFAERSGANPSTSVVTLLLELRNHDKISPAEYELLRGLYELRMEAAATSVGFSKDAVLNFVVAASSVLRKLGLSPTPGRSAALRSNSLAVKLYESD